MTVLEIITGGVGSNFLYISQGGVGILDSKIPQEAAAVFPEFEIGRLNQILHQRSRRVPPKGDHAHHGKADGLSHPRNELLPGLVISAGAETDNVFQRQR